jgi:drug/metabolite transporter (DMT)-like permease
VKTVWHTAFAGGGDKVRHPGIRRFATFGFLGLIWGSEWITSRAIDLPPLNALAARYAMAAIVLAFIAGIRRPPLPDLRRVWIAALTGVTLLAIPSILLAWATSRVSPGLLVVLLAMTPLIAALFEGRASGALLPPLIGGVAGTALIASHALSFSGIQWLGAAAVIVSAVLVAASIVIIKRKLTETSPLLISAIQFPIAAFTVGFASLAFEHPARLDLSPAAIQVEAGLAVLGNVIAFPLYYWLLKSMEGFQLTASQWLITVVGLMEGLLIVQAAPNWRIVVGIAIIIASLWILATTLAGDDTPPGTPLNLQVTPRN